MGRVYKNHAKFKSGFIVQLFWEDCVRTDYWVGPQLKKKKSFTLEKVI
jgi:hypothetical protein